MFRLTFANLTLIRRPMSTSRLRFSLVLLLAGLAMLCAGCSGPRSSNSGGLFGKKEVAKAEGPKVKTPAERLKELHELAETAPDLPAAEQERRSHELATAIANEQDALLRAQMLRTLATFDTPTSAHVLTAGFSDPDADVRIATCEAWGTKGGPKATERLAAALANDTDIDVRLAAARALADSGGPQAVQALGLALDDSNPAMQRRAMLSLQKATGEDFGNDVRAWREFVQGRQPRKPEESLAQSLFPWLF